ncbi:MAG: hypothetical protein V1494_06915 [Candidatus Diapherotrites archaeon]
MGKEKIPTRLMPNDLFTLPDVSVDIGSRIFRRPEDNRPITKFFDFLETITELLRSVLTRFLKISDTAWKSILAIAFLMVLWKSGDLQNTIFVIIVAVLAVLTVIDIAIENWGAIARKLRKEKIFAEIKKEAQTSIIQEIDSYNIIGIELTKTISLLVKNSWNSPVLIDSLLTQQELNPDAIDELYKLKLSKKDTIRLISYFPNLINLETMKKILADWKDDKEIIKAALKNQLNAIEEVKIIKNIPNEKFWPLERMVPLIHFQRHWTSWIVWAISTILFLVIFYILLIQYSINAIVQNLPSIYANSMAVQILLSMQLIFAFALAFFIGIILHAILVRVFGKIFYDWQEKKFSKLYEAINKKTPQTPT